MTYVNVQEFISNLFRFWKKKVVAPINSSQKLRSSVLNVINDFLLNLADLRTTARKVNRRITAGPIS